MCLAIPGKVMSIEGDEPMLRAGQVQFGGITRKVSLAYVPEVKLGDYVLVHVGFALNIVDEEEANRVFELLKEMDELDELSQELPS
ncbi:MAG: HypC/HybG/HupF family hydrogenase formation chaperone [Kiritimatiellae bacterium]|nr:HypC/HybG/HupF family hydrogenase formation chaperone [Kiritimatiellia bacterium]MCB1102840.1 HypC/HybG/HupF family hydrogenase formation chaperone [Kiritimatiellia bacterium]